MALCSCSIGLKLYYTAYSQKESHLNMLSFSLSLCLCSVPLTTLANIHRQSSVLFTISNITVFWSQLLKSNLTPGREYDQYLALSSSDESFWPEQKSAPSMTPLNRESTLNINTSSVIPDLKHVVVLTECFFLSWSKSLSCLC